MTFLRQLADAFERRLADPATWRGIAIDLAIGAAITTIGLVLTVRRRRAVRRLRRQKAWAIAASAVLTEVNGDDHWTLSGLPPTQARARGRRVLEQWWGVRDRPGLLAMLTWLGERGHRAELAALLEGAEAPAHRLEWARQHGDGERCLLAWDLCRLISVARWGYAAGYLSAAEAWRAIMGAAATLRTRFTSWNDLGAAYVVGRGFWREHGHEPFEAALARLCDAGNARSPWNVVPWEDGPAGR